MVVKVKFGAGEVVGIFCVLIVGFVVVNAWVDNGQGWYEFSLLILAFILGYGAYRLHIYSNKKIKEYEARE